MNPVVILLSAFFGVVAIVRQGLGPTRKPTRASPPLADEPDDEEPDDEPDEPEAPIVEPPARRERREVDPAPETPADAEVTT